MAFSSGKLSITLQDILNSVTEADILAFYLGVLEIPNVIHSPLRKDNKPSFGLYSLDGKKIYYKDLSTGDRGGVFDLLMNLWNLSYEDTLKRVYEDMVKFHNNSTVKKYNPCIVRRTDTYNKNSNLLCKVRDWKDYDIEYWNKYGITLKWLKYAEVYPVSHIIVEKNDQKFTLNADKYAYAYVEHKEGNTTLKIYQPFNKNGYKWSNKHDSSVISLWTKVPKESTNICICASLKDALCLWINTGIPSLAVQGEGYNLSDTAINELKKRYKNIFILFDNDETGIVDGKRLSEKTGFINVVLPKFEGGKDVSDYYYILQDKRKFKTDLLKLFKI